MARKQKTVFCRKCDAEIPAKSKRCPACNAKNRKPIYKRLWFIILVFILVLSAISSIKNMKRIEKIDWEDIELSYMLPEIQSNVGQILSNSDETLSIYVNRYSKNAYKAFREDCIFLGYTIDAEKSNTSYSAFNESGYKLSIRYTEDDKEMYISLNVPMELGKLTWPSSDIANQLPTPYSTVGKVTRESSDSLFAYVGDTSIEEYARYVNECYESGFSVDYQKGDTFFYGDNSTGYHVSVKYTGFNIISINIDAPDDISYEVSSETASIEVQTKETIQETTEATEESTQETNDAPTTGTPKSGLRPEFKEAMDSYEAFYDEYCEFFQKYNKNPSDLTLLVKYGELLVNAEEMDKAFEEWDEDDLNKDELKYYLDVNNRVMQKMLDVME